MVRAAPHGKAAGLAGPASAVSWPAVETSWKDQLLATSATFAGIAARCCDYLPPDTHQGTTARSLPLCIVITFLELFGAMVALGNRYRKFYRTLNNAKKPFIQYSIQKFF